jgi:hypothetical protein
MQADYLSRHPIDDLNDFHDTLWLEKVETHCAGCTQDDLLWRRRPNHNYPDRYVIVQPASL